MIKININSLHTRFCENKVIIKGHLRINYDTKIINLKENIFLKTAKDQKISSVF